MTQNEVAAAVEAQAAVQAQVAEAQAAAAVVKNEVAGNNAQKPRFQWSKEARNAAQRARQMVNK